MQIRLLGNHHFGGGKLYHKYYKSRTKMCENYGIDRKLFEYRIKNGYTLEEALTLPSKEKPVRA